MNDLSFASTETKYIKVKTQTQNNIVIFGIYFFKKVILLFWLLEKQMTEIRVFTKKSAVFFCQIISKKAKIII